MTTEKQIDDELNFEEQFKLNQFLKAGYSDMIDLEEEFDIYSNDVEFSLVRNGAKAI